jgi:hypothetical protein
MRGWRPASIITFTFLAVGLLVAPGAALAQDDGHEHSAPVDPLAAGGMYTSDLSRVTWWVPEGFQPITHGIPSAGEHAESYVHHAMVNYPGGAAGEMPTDASQVMMEIGVNPVDQLCLEGSPTEATPEQLIGALVDYNARLFAGMDRSFPPVEIAEATTWSDGTVAGTATMAMGDAAGEWTAWLLDDDTVGWLFVGSTPDAEVDAISNKIATSLAFEGDAAFLDELFTDWMLGDLCAPLPTA